MNTDSKLMDMLTGYAASHQHPFNVLVHMIGIPTIMFGVLIPLTWLQIELPIGAFTLAHVLLLGFVLFYLTLDVVFALAFAVLGFVLLVLAHLRHYTECDLIHSVPQLLLTPLEILLEFL